MSYKKSLVAGWGDMDFNRHMRNTAYLDKSADLRMMYFESQGFSMADFNRLQLGPVVQQDSVTYFREIHLLETFEVTLALRELSEDGSRFTLLNEFYKADGRLAARVESRGGWLDLSQRALVAPPAELLACLKAMPQAEPLNKPT